ncbi:MAG: transposase [Bdellovibrionota bacterium]
MSRRPTQPLLDPIFKPRTEHGSTVRKGRRKLMRPIDARRPMHVVFRSSKARGELSFLHPKHVSQVNRLISALARKYGVTIHEFANVGNHFHLLIKGRSRTAIQNFLRAVGSRVAQLVTGAKKGKPFRKTKEGRAFWDELVFTRVIASGLKSYRAVKNYIWLNVQESIGLLPQARRSRPRRP